MTPGGEVEAGTRGVRVRASHASGVGQINGVDVKEIVKPDEDIKEAEEDVKVELGI